MPSSTCAHHRSAFPRCKMGVDLFYGYDYNMFLSFRGEMDHMSEKEIRTSISSNPCPQIGRRCVPVFIKPGPSGKIIVAEDPDGSFTKAGSPDKKGAEHGNKIWYIINEEDLDSYGVRYSNGTSNLNDASSSAGKNRLNIIYGVDATKMHKNKELADIAAKGKFRRVYLIHPRYTYWERIWAKEAKVAARGGVSVSKTRAEALNAELETQKDSEVIGLKKTPTTCNLTYLYVKHTR